MARKFYLFVMICLAVMGLIGGIGYAIWGGSWPIAVGVAVLAFMAWPKFNEYREELLS